MSRLDAWSRRKALVAREEAALAEARAAQEAEAREAALAERPDAEILEELGLPEPESLGAGDDFSVFLRAALPARIKRRALRRLWLAEPALGAVDGLVEYGEDFSRAGIADMAVETLYRVGRGVRERLQEALAEEDEAAGPGAAAGAGEAPAAMPAEPSGEPPRPGDTSPPESQTQLADEAPATARPRRMRIRYRDAEEQRA